MSAITAKRYADTLSERFAALLNAWLGTLPAGGWKGTAAELHEVLAAHRDRIGAKFTTSVPAGSGLSKTLMATPTPGWAVEFTRTKSARSITFTRLPTPARTAKKGK